MPLGPRNIDNTGDSGLPTGFGLTAVRTKAVTKRLMEIQAEDNYAVSPSTPLLSTHISENSYVCGR
jgi:ERCC4-related helicase